MSTNLDNFYKERILKGKFSLKFPKDSPSGNLLKVGEILKATQGVLLQGPQYKLISGISTDSRQIKKGEIFVALKGERYDGHLFVRDALRKGAKGAIISNLNYQLPITNYQIIIKVRDTLRALGDIARYHRNKFRCALVAITGSNGKSSTKEIAAQLLGKYYRVLKTSGNHNNLIGVPRTLLDLNSQVDIAVLEMGMNCPGEIRRLAEIASPQVALITNVGKAHLGGFESLEKVASAKAELLEGLSEETTVILNQDSPFFPYFVSKTRGRIATFGICARADFRAVGVEYDSLGRACFYLNGYKEVKLPFPGEGNIYNTLAAFALARSFGLGIGDCLSSLPDITLPDQRVSFYEWEGVLVLNDTYNANPSSFSNLLHTVERITVCGKKILLLGDMLELGKFSDREHERLGEHIRSSSIDIVITTGEKAHLAGEIVRRSKQVFFLEDVSEAKRLVLDLVEEGDLIVAKGSREMRMEEALPEISATGTNLLNNSASQNYEGKMRQEKIEAIRI